MRNCQPLSPEQLKYLLEHYKVYLDGNYIIVATMNGGSRKTVHDKHKEFFISSPLRKIKLLNKAVKLWQEHLKDYELIEVQNALNYSEVVYIEQTIDNLIKIIKDYKKKMKEIKNEIKKEN